MINVNETTGEATKVCCKCHEEKPLTDFARSNSSKDGYQGYCKECRNKASRAYYRARRSLKNVEQPAPQVVTKDGKTLTPLISKFSTDELQAELKKRNDRNLAEVWEPVDLIDALYKAGYRGELTREEVVVHKVKLRSRM